MTTYLGNASDHVANVGLERVDSAGLLVAAEPDANTDKVTSALLVVLLHLLKLASDVREVLRHSSSLALDSNFPCIHCALNYHIQKFRVSTTIVRTGCHLPSAGISTQSIVNICLILLISSLLNNNNTPLPQQM